MKGKMILIKKYFFPFIVLLLLIIYLLSANFLFDQLIQVKGESQIVTINLPGASKDIRYSIDHIYNSKLEWKEMLTITGWAFIANQNTENCSIFLVFSGNNSQYIFKTSPVLRRGVTRFFANASHTKFNLDNSGFEANIPKVFLDNNRYQLGILIKNQTAQRYIITKNYCINGNCSIIESRIGS